MKFSSIQFATIASSLLSTVFADIVYVTKTNQVIEYATVTAGADPQALTSSIVESFETSISQPYTWVFSTNVLGQDIVFSSIVSGDFEQAYRTLYEEHVIVQKGDYFSTQTLVVQANPTTLATSTLNSSGSTGAISTSVEATAVNTEAITGEQQPTVSTSISIPTTSESSKDDTQTTSTQAPAPTTSSTTSPTQQTTPSTTSTQTSTTTSSTSDSDFGDVKDASFAKAILDAHNEKRAAHGAPALSWEQSAYDYAQAYADKYDCSGNLKHSGGSYGENLAVGYADGPSAVEAWYSEGANHDYSSNSNYDHFTQLIWASTTKLGCAYKDCSAENWGKYIICSYDPAGNVMGQFTKNVFPPTN